MPPNTAREGQFDMGTGGSPYDRPPQRPTNQQLNLNDILQNRFVPELDRIGANMGNIEQMFMDAYNAPIDFSQYNDALSTFAGGVSDQYFAPGGIVEQQSRQALGQTVNTGFGTTSGGFDNARMNILSGATGAMNNAIAMQAGELARLAQADRQNQLATAFGYLGLEKSRADALRESLFGGAATERVYGMDERMLRLNEMMVMNEFGDGEGFDFTGRLGSGAGGALSGAAAGSMIGSAGGPIGMGLGALIGGLGGFLTG